MGTYIAFMGVQGAGKGTQAPLLSEKYGLPHVTTGGLFRAMKALDTPLARQIQDTMNAGQLVSDEITIQVVRDRLKQPDAANGVIFDGFPRTLPQAEALDSLLAEMGGKVNFAPFLSLDRTEAIERIASRWECTKDSSHVYNVRTNPPKVAGICDTDGAALRQRPDDTPEAAAKRIDTFYKDTMPLIDFYRAKGVLVEIDGGQSIEAVTAALIAALDKVK